MTSEVVLLIAYWSKAFKRAKPGSVDVPPQETPNVVPDHNLLHAAIAPSTETFEYLGRLPVG